MPVPLTDPSVTAVIQLITANNGVSPAPPPQRGSAVLVDLIGDGVPDLVVSATYSDDSIYYRLVAIAPDVNPDAASTVMIEFGGSFHDDGTRDPQSRGELRVDGVVELTGAPPFELFIRRTTSNTKGVSIRDLTGAELATWSCPRGPRCRPRSALAPQWVPTAHRAPSAAGLSSSRGGPRSRSPRHRRRSTRSPRWRRHARAGRRWRRRRNGRQSRTSPDR